MTRTLLDPDNCSHRFSYNSDVDSLGIVTRILLKVWLEVWKKSSWNYEQNFSGIQIRILNPSRNLSKFKKSEETARGISKRVLGKISKKFRKIPPINFSKIPGRVSEVNAKKVSKRILWKCHEEIRGMMQKKAVEDVLKNPWWCIRDESMNQFWKEFTHFGRNFWKKIWNNFKIRGWKLTKGIPGRNVEEYFRNFLKKF